MSYLRIFVLVVLSYLLSSMLYGAAVAQTANTSLQNPPAETTVEQIETAAKEIPFKTATPTTNVDLDDPAIKAAIEAIKEADKAREDADKVLADAVRAQVEANGAAALEAANSGTSKASIIPSNAEEVKDLVRKIGNKVLGWLTSIKFLAQVGAIVLAYTLSPLFARALRKRIFLFRDPPEEAVKLKLVRDYIYRSAALLRPILMVALLIFFGAILKAVPLGGAETGAEGVSSAAASTWLVKIAQSLAVVFLLYKAIQEFVRNDLFKTLSIWTIIPLALIMLFGYFDNLISGLDSVSLMEMGGKPITLMTLVLLVIFGSLFFKLGNIANSKGQTAIRAQEGLDLPTQEVVAKIFQILLFTFIFILVMGAAKIPLSGLVVIFSALSLGVGLGLQPVAANFVSGMIILFDRSVRAGDFVVLPDGQEGFVEAINMRNTIVETTDGKDIMVPNTTFTESAYENWTHKDPRQRYEVHFMVAYDTDLDTLEDLILPVFHNHPSVLKEPEMPDLEFREFGEYGVKMAVEFWCSGIDDGPNKFTSDLNFSVWRALRDNKIKIPFPQMVIHKG